MRLLRLAVCLVASSCWDSTSPATPITASLTGIWVGGSAGPLIYWQIELTEQGSTNPVIEGKWSGYVAGCAPLFAPECFREGDISSEKSSRTGATVVLELVPTTPCTDVSATLTMTMTSNNRMQGTYSPNPCPNQDLRTTSMTLNRQ